SLRGYRFCKPVTRIAASGGTRRSLGSHAGARAPGLFGGALLRALLGDDRPGRRHHDRAVRESGALVERLEAALVGVADERTLLGEVAGDGLLQRPARAPRRVAAEAELQDRRPGRNRQADDVALLQRQRLG